MSAKTFWIFIALFSAAVFSWCVYRDVQIEKQFTNDLRNRIVGSRLQKDGKLPYFYKWRPGDGTRYYDENNSQSFATLKTTSITATPFFHDLLYPIADLPGRTISYIWSVIEYLTMVASVVIAFFFAKSNIQQWSVLIAAALFLFTEAWVMHIANGQMYILVPFLCFLFCYFVCHKNNSMFAFLAGLCTVVLVLIRPNAIVFFLPFLAVIKNYNLRFFAFFVAPIVLVIGLIMINKQERSYWINFSEQLNEQVKLHQDMHPTKQKNYPDPKFESYEGWSEKKIAEDYKKFPYDPHSENGNVFVALRDILHIKVPVWLLSVLSFSSIIIVFIFFQSYRKKNGGYGLPNLAVIGFCLYMITDLFSPFFRGQYYAVQWLFPLLIVAAYMEKEDWWVCVLAVVALLLSIINTDLIKMEHSIGEYLFLVTFILFALKRKINPVI